MSDKLLEMMLSRGVASRAGREMAKTVPTALVRDVVGDSRIASPNQPGGMPEARPIRGGGMNVVAAQPLPSNPPGWNHIDRLLDADDAKWRAERQKALGAKEQGNG